MSATVLRRQLLLQLGAVIKALVTLAKAAGPGRPLGAKPLMHDVLSSPIYPL